MNPEGERQPWLLGLDVAPVHVSAETRHALSEKFSWVHKVYVCPKKTYCSQPLDLCYMYPFKRYMSNAASTHFARQVVANFDEEGELKLDLKLSTLKPLLLTWIHEAIGKLQANESLRPSAWKYARTSSADEFADVLARATHHNEDGTLFRKAQHGVVPEAAPAAGEVSEPLPPHVDPADEDMGYLEDEDLDNHVVHLLDEPTAEDQAEVGTGEEIPEPVVESPVADSAGPGQADLNDLNTKLAKLITKIIMEALL